MRLLAMQTSYRKPLNFTWEALSSANSQLKKLQNFASIKESGGNITDSYKQEFIESISEDINTAKALAVVWKMLADENISRPDKYTTLLSFDEVLGLDLASTPEFSISEEATILLEKMKLARENKDYSTSDAIRSELEALGYKVEQNAQGISLS
jgi:cysteinyl-tRNA synthetase